MSTGLVGARRAQTKGKRGSRGPVGAWLGGMAVVATIVAGCDGSGASTGAGGTSTGAGGTSTGAGGASGGAGAGIPGIGGTRATQAEAGSDAASGITDASTNRAQDSGGELGREASTDSNRDGDTVGDAGASEFSGCTYIGNLDHFVVFRRDLARDLCIELLLDFPGQPPPAGLTLPARFGFIAAGAAPGWACLSGGYIAIAADRVSGVVEAKSSSASGDPARLRLDVTLSFGANDAGVEPTEKLSVDDVDVTPMCPVPACTFGADQSCNDNPALSSLHGRCTPASTCICNSGFVLNPQTGRCL